MKKAQIAVLGVAVAAGAAAYALMPGAAPPPVIETVRIAPPVDTDDVLVAAKDMQYGMTLTEADLAWQPWPKSSAIQNVIRKAATPKAIEDIKGSVVRGQFAIGEPIRRERLVKGPTAGLMSTMLAQGHRAVAINIDSNGASSAGGFILPNDRVDIIRTFRDEDASKAGQGDVFVSQTILNNVRVLAVGQNIQTENGKPVVVGSNATLELDPKQTEYIVLAQRTGQLSLVLRSMIDAVQAGPAEIAAPQSDDKSLTIVRFGVPVQVRNR